MCVAGWRELRRRQRQRSGLVVTGRPPPWASHPTSPSRGRPRCFCSARTTLYADTPDSSSSGHILSYVTYNISKCVVYCIKHLPYDIPRCKILRILVFLFQPKLITQFILYSAYIPPKIPVWRGWRSNVRYMITLLSPFFTILVFLTFPQILI